MKSVSTQVIVLGRDIGWRGDVNTGSNVGGRELVSRGRRYLPDGWLIPTCTRPFNVLAGRRYGPLPRFRVGVAARGIKVATGICTPMAGKAGGGGVQWRLSRSASRGDR